jgi:hypothetical protein
MIQQLIQGQCGGRWSNFQETILWEFLQQRGIFTQAQIKQIADQLEAVRKEVLTTVRAAEEREVAQDLQRRLESYLLVTNKAELTPEGIERNFKPLLQDPEATMKL